MNEESKNSLIYKIVDRENWHQAIEAGRFDGAAVDLTDGFIHFSTDEQVAETLRLHFPGVSNLMLIAVETSRLGENLKWEPSRGGELFPHLFAPLRLGDAVWSKELPLGSDGNHVLPSLH
jgi:uncharacterized protein (DUF952 family)